MEMPPKLIKELMDYTDAICINQFIRFRRLFEPAGHTAEDLKQMGYIWMLEAYELFKDKPKEEMLKLINTSIKFKLGHLKRECCLKNPILNGQLTEEYLEEYCQVEDYISFPELDAEIEDFQQLLSIIDGQLDDKEKRIFRLHLEKGLNTNQIAKKMELSQPYVYTLLQKVFEICKKEHKQLF